MSSPIEFLIAPCIKNNDVDISLNFVGNIFSLMTIQLSSFWISGHIFGTISMLNLNEVKGKL